MTTSQADLAGRITDEGIEKMRMRIGIPAQMPLPFNREAHPDTMRHFAYGYGDDNPLFTDEEYAAGTRWGEVIAPPLYIATLGRSLAGPMPEDIKRASKGALAGVGEFLAGSRWTFSEPVRRGDRVIAHSRMTDVTEQESSTFGGRTVRTDHRVDFTRESDGAPLGVHEYWFFRVERGQREGSKEKPAVPAPFYSEEQMEQIEADILAESIRGAEPRYVEDVSVGDAAGALTKGPLRVSDILAWHIGNGPGTNQWGAFRLLSKTRKRVRGFFNHNEFGAWDLVQRVHWEPAWAQKVGLARSYDYGMIRDASLGQLVTDWMGDDALLLSLETTIRKFNYEGDLTVITGEVSAIEGNVVEITARGVNQRGETSCTGLARVALPSRHTGLPQTGATS